MEENKIMNYSLELLEKELERIEHYKNESEMELKEYNEQINSLKQAIKELKETK